MARPRVATPEPLHDANRILFLQRTVGNQAVQRIMQTHIKELKSSHAAQQTAAVGTERASQTTPIWTPNVFRRDVGILQRQHRERAPRAVRAPFDPPRGTWVLVSLEPIGGGAGGIGYVRVYDGSTLRYRRRAAGGQAGHVTPVGEFRIDFRDEEHRSSEYGFCIRIRGGSRRRVGTGCAACRSGERYEGADMAFFQRFAPLVGFHRGDPSQVSHGCIHLQDSDARRLWTDIGRMTKVIVCAGAECRWYIDGILAERRALAQERARQRRERR